MRNFWVVNDKGDHGNIITDDERKADIILFKGMLSGEYPPDALLIEEMTPEWEIAVYEPLDDSDIISIEEA